MRLEALYKCYMPLRLCLYHFTVFTQRRHYQGCEVRM